MNVMLHEHLNVRMPGLLPDRLDSHTAFEQIGGVGSPEQVWGESQAPLDDSRFLHSMVDLPNAAPQGVIRHGPGLISPERRLDPRQRVLRPGIPPKLSVEIPPAGERVLAVEGGHLVADSPIRDVLYNEPLLHDHGLQKPHSLVHHLHLGADQPSLHDRLKR